VRLAVLERPRSRGGVELKSAEEIMEILEAFDLTGSLRDAAELAGCSHHTVARYVAAREAGGLSDRPAARPQLIDEYLPKVEEWVDRSKGKVRADRVHERLLALGYAGSERTTRRAVAQVRRAYRAGRVRVHRPWVAEPGMWLLCGLPHSNQISYFCDGDKNRFERLPRRSAPRSSSDTIRSSKQRRRTRRMLSDRHADLRHEVRRKPPGVMPTSVADWLFCLVSDLRRSA
jgi:hypothetical protein